MNIIDGRQKRSIKALENILTAFGWSYMVIYISQIVISLILWRLNLTQLYNELILGGNITATVYTVFITVGIALVNLLIMRAWGIYNYNRFSHLNRRKFKEYVQQEELQKHFKLSEEVIQIMQNDKIIVLDKTIV